ncbi:MAG: type II toxin-antitoxin system RelE/ParE family toxin [Pseudomonadota bacterium]
MNSRFRLATAAKKDIRDILDWSAVRFGESARTRYAALILAGVGDVAADPHRPGSVSRPELGDGARVWHLRHSRISPDALEGNVRRPRHFILYRQEGDRVLIGRVLHESMDLIRRTPWLDA